MTNKFLKSLKDVEGIFHNDLQKMPMGKYAHIIILRETKSFDIFQTDSQLNISTVRKGLDEKNRAKTNRIVMFKRKQTTPERLEGRKELREQNINTLELLKKMNNSKLNESLGKYINLSDNSKFKDKNSLLMSNCEYNSYACKICPDCIIYGFAIGDSGSEKSKVITDSAFSLNGYETSHLYASFNGLFENGTMHKYESSKTEVTQSTSLNSKDHTNPEIFFPSIVTIKDPTELSFLYVLSSIKGNKRYGAQITRTGTIENHILGVIFSNREIFSNLKLTQSIYDNLENNDEFDYFDVEKASLKSIQALLKQEATIPKKILMKNTDEYKMLENEVLEVNQKDENYKSFMEELTKESLNYSFNCGVLHLGTEKKKGR